MCAIYSDVSWRRGANMDCYAFYVGMQAFLSKGKIPDSRSQRRKLKRASANFTIKDNRLFYIGPSRKYMRLVVLSEEEKRSVLTECHYNPKTGNHSGVRGTQNRVIAGYYWPTVIQDVKKWIRSCQHCQLNDPMKTVGPVLHSTKVKDAWDVLVLDLIGPLPETARNNKYVLSMTDLHTKWVIAEPIQSKTAAEVSAVITTKLYSFGMVRKIITDQGKEFVKQLNSSIFSMLKIKNAVSSVCNPQTNGQDERTDQNIKRSLRKYVTDNHSDWDLHLPALVFGINTTKQYSTRHSPYFLLFHRHRRLPAVMNVCPVGDDFEVSDPEEDSRGNKTKRLNETVQAGEDVLLSRDPKKQRTVDAFTSPNHGPGTRTVASVSSKEVAAVAKGSACQILGLKDEPSETILVQDHCYSTLELQIEHSYACSGAKWENDFSPNQDILTHCNHH